MPRRYKNGLFPLSGDPITLGHVDIIARCARQCEALVVLVANNEQKAGRYVFELEERLEMARRAVRDAGLSNVRVIASDGLLVDTYLEEGCDCLFRSTRNKKDIQYEEQLADVNKVILRSIVIKSLEAKKLLRLVSSSLSKDFVRGGLGAEWLVPLFIKQRLEEKLLGQYRVMITGGIAVGKTHVAKALVARAEERGMDASLINVDELLRELYAEQTPGAQIVRDAFAERFGPDVLTPDRTAVNRARLADLMSAPDGTEHRKWVPQVTKPHVERLYRKALRGKKGLIVLEWAQAAEMDMLSWANNNVILIDSLDRNAFLEKRETDAGRPAPMKSFQWTTKAKREELGNRIAEDKSGWVIEHDNRIRPSDEEFHNDVLGLLNQVREKFPGLKPKP